MITAWRETLVVRGDRLIQSGYAESPNGYPVAPGPIYPGEQIEDRSPGACPKSNGQPYRTEWLYEFRVTEEMNRSFESGARRPG